MRKSTRWTTPWAGRRPTQSRRAPGALWRHFTVVAALLALLAATAVLAPTAHAAAPGSWATVAPMPTARASLAAATGADGRIYALGGRSSTGAILNTAEAYDPATNSWATLAPMPTARNSLAAATGPDGRIYAIGGITTNNIVVATVEAYDPATDSWATVAPMPTPLERMAAATGADGRIYVFGGINEISNVSFNSVEAYDPATNNWTILAQRTTPLSDLAVAAGPDGRIYLFGGQNGGGPIATAEAYDPATNSFATLASLPAPLYGLAAATGPDGRIYALGGVGGGCARGCVVDTVDAYDPATNSWAAATPLPAARAGLAAATGPDGRIFALGGIDNGGNATGFGAAEVSTVYALTVATVTRSTTTTLSSSPNPPVVGQPVTYTANVSPVPDGGTVSFADGGVAITGCGAVSVNASTGAATCPVTYAAVGSHTITASYSGDTNFLGSDSASLVQVVNQASTTTTLGSSPNPSVVGGLVTFTATIAVSAPGAGEPTGTVSFANSLEVIPTCDAVSVDPSTGDATCVVTYNEVGDDTITASYSGDTNFTGSSAASLAQTVNQASPTLTTTASLDTANNQTILSDSAVLADGYNPLGSITFTLFAPDGVTVVHTETAQVKGNGTYTTNGYAIGPVAGTYQWTASYSGDANNKIADDQGGTDEQVTVGRITTTTLSSSPSGSAVVGQPVTYTAIVSPVPDFGYITFTDNGADIFGCGQASVDLSTGIATCQTTYTTVGDHVIAATYDGDVAFASSSDSLSLQVDQASTTTTLVSPTNAVIVGSAVLYTATVAVDAPGAGTPTGTVTFTDNGVPVAVCASEALIRGLVDCFIPFTIVGSHTISAVYNGDTNFAGSVSADLLLQVLKNSTTTSLAVTSPTQQSGLPAGTAVSVAGQAVMFTAVLNPIPLNATVSFTDGATTLCANVPLSTSDTATCSMTYSAAGQHSITASYSGNADFKSSSANLTLYVNSNISSFLKNGVYNLSGVNLADGSFFGANLSGATLTSANLSGANFTNATLSGANLTGANFSGANLSGANLSNAILLSASFSNANLSGANLSGANLSSGNFSGAKFAGANLSGANLTRANLKGATGLASATLSGVIWSNTTCPDNTSSNRDGGTCVGHL